MMTYDDIANNQKNPLPGQVFNHPDGTDVYAVLSLITFVKM